jgi:hypothetical protein
VLARRRLLLRGLGKGAVAAAALSPLASQATRSYTLHNPIVGRDGYCSVSGFQSAAISVAPGQAMTTCSALPPDGFYAVTEATYTWNTGNNATQNGNNRRAAVRALLQDQFGFTLAEATNVGNGRLNTLITVGVPAIFQGALDALFLSVAFDDPGPGSNTGSGTLRRIKTNANYPSAVANAGPLRSFENMMDNVGTGGNVDNANAASSVLFTLYNVQPDNKAYFAAVALGCIKEDAAFQSSGGFGAGLIPFDAKYVGDMYNDAGKRDDAGVFFRTLCGK